MKVFKLVLAVAVVAAVGAVSFWLMRDGKEVAPVENVARAVPQETVKAPEPVRVEEPRAEVVAKEEFVAPAVEPVKEAEPVATGPMLTAETLKGTKWSDDKIDMVFLPDGQWQMNGRTCAKWVVEGSRVKIFDDKGEVHYVDIVGDSLAFNGKKIGKVSG